jgi:type VI secretion system protein ImpF
MARSKTETLITQSLLDRLSDQEDWPSKREASMRMLRESIKRDVEWLLNTRKPFIPIVEEYEQASVSVINYGLPDLNVFQGSAERDHNALLASMLKTIRIFEPRISDPKVFLVRTDVLSRSLRFHVEGRIEYESIMEDIQFDTVLELLNGEYEVK